MFINVATSFIIYQHHNSIVIIFQMLNQIGLFDIFVFFKLFSFCYTSICHDSSTCYLTKINV